MINNQTKPAIAIASYNRPKSLLRLLSAIRQAEYKELDIPLIISIDGGGVNNYEICQIAEGFEWQYGTKIIIKHSQNLGLRKHILSCGDLSYEYGAVIVLEDDIFVAKHFYVYTQDALQYYQNDDRIAQISLYSFNIHIHTLLPFVPMKSEFDTYFMQYGSSWGQCWTQSQWNGFRQWFNSGQMLNESDRLPRNIINWPESSWLKYFIKFLTESGKVVVYPYWGYATNINDAGVHNRVDQFTYQSLLANQKISNNFAPYHDLSVKYDVYFELSADYLKSLNKDLKKYEFEVDLYGQKLLDGVNAENFLSTLKCTTPILQYPIILKPLEQNIVLNIPNDKYGIFLGQKKSFIIGDNRIIIWNYYVLPLSIGKAIRQLFLRISKSLSYHIRIIFKNGYTSNL